MEKLRKFFEGRDKERLGTLFVVFLVGILLITVMSNFSVTEEKEDTTTYVTKPEEQVSRDTYAKELEDRLSNILSKVDGAGEVSVMVTISTNGELVLSNLIDEEYDSEEETDEDGVVKKILSTSKKQEPVLITESSGKDIPLVIKEKSPEIEGVIIVAEGGDNVYIKDGLIKSVTSALGIPSHKVQVLKGTSKNLELIK